MKIRAFVKFYFYRINLSIIKVMAEDCRKIATYTIGIGIIGYIIGSDNISNNEALLAIISGLYFWVLGIILTYLEDRLEKREK